MYKKKLEGKSAFSFQKPYICKVCCEPINKSAIKCNKCGCYQDWTRHLLRWTALVISLLALAPLWSISKSLSKLAISDNHANIEAVISGYDNNSIRMVLENTGKISGIVTGVTFALLQDGKRMVPDLDIRNNLGEKDIIISPQKAPVRVIYRPYIDNTQASFIQNKSAQKECFYELGIDWIDLEGSKKRLIKKCECP